MPDNSDPIDALQAIVDEVRRLRDDANRYRTYIENITMRVAVWQLDHGPLPTEAATRNPHWDVIRTMVESGEVRLDHVVTALRGYKVLSKENL